MNAIKVVDNTPIVYNQELIKICAHCGMNVFLRNPSGFCDHLYFPSWCSTCYFSFKKGKGLYKE